MRLLWRVAASDRMVGLKHARVLIDCVECPKYPDTDQRMLEPLLQLRGLLSFGIGAAPEPESWNESRGWKAEDLDQGMRCRMRRLLILSFKLPYSPAPNGRDIC